MYVLILSTVTPILSDLPLHLSALSPPHMSLFHTPLGFVVLFCGPLSLNWRCGHRFGHSHWNMIGTPFGTQERPWLSLSPESISCQKFNRQGQRPMSLSSIHNWLLIDPVLYRHKTGFCSCCKIVFAMAMSCPEERILCLLMKALFLSPSLYMHDMHFLLIKHLASPFHMC